MLGDDAASVQSILSLQKAPVKHDDKERLMWERELLGLYISAHPLDRYETYLSEQTQPLTQLVPEYDSRMMTVGGIISTVRTIVTKSGSKMAFVGIEDKFGEGEIIVFPNLYEKVGAKLLQDTVIRVSGKNSARDRDGNLGNESKLIADDIIVITDNDINGYESTGRKMDAPKVSSAVKKERREAYRSQKNGATLKSTVKNNTSKSQPKTQPAPVNVTPEITTSKLFVYIKDPNDHSRLVKMKSVCSENAGTTDVVLVLGEKEKSAMRLPFKVDANDNLLSQLKNTLGEECVVLK